MTPKCHTFSKYTLLRKCTIFGKIYYFGSLLGVPNFGTISCFALFFGKILYFGKIILGK